MKLTIGQAAKDTGKSKSTISRAIKTGRISAQKTGDRYEIDPAELFRAFPPATGAQPSQSNDTQPPSPTPSQPDPATETELRMLREMLDRERETVTDLRERLTRAELLLTDQRAKPKKWFWQK